MAASNLVRGMDICTRLFNNELWRLLTSYRCLSAVGVRHCLVCLRAVLLSGRKFPLRHRVQTAFETSQSEAICLDFGLFTDEFQVKLLHRVEYVFASILLGRLTKTANILLVNKPLGHFTKLRLSK
jgi:hypothetical protein